MYENNKTEKIINYDAVTNKKHEKIMSQIYLKFLIIHTEY